MASSAARSCTSLCWCGLFDDPGARGAVTSVVREGMEAAGPPVALERLTGNFHQLTGNFHQLEGSSQRPSAT